MSKLTAILTTLVLGTSSIAMAQPSSYTPMRYDDRYDDRFDDRVDDHDHDDWRDHRSDRGWDRRDRERTDVPRRYRSSWISLAEPMQLSYGRDSIDVRRRGTFTQLRLQTVAGASYVHRVIVRFGDGSRQVVDVRGVIDPRSRMLQFLLDGNNRRIDRITVIGRSERGAAIQVFGI